MLRGRVLSAEQNRLSLGRVTQKQFHFGLTSPPVLQCPPPQKLLFGPCSLEGIFKEESHKQIEKTPCASFWPKCLKHSRIWSQPRHTVSRDFRFGNLFPKVGKHSLSKTKPPITLWREKNIYFLKKTLSSELKFTLFSIESYEFPWYRVRRMIFLWAVGFGRFIPRTWKLPYPAETKQWPFLFLSRIQ